jgi:hypothetical protein
VPSAREWCAVDESSFPTDAFDAIKGRLKHVRSLPAGVEAHWADGDPTDPWSGAAGFPARVERARDAELEDGPEDWTVPSRKRR